MSSKLVQRGVHDVAADATRTAADEATGTECSTSRTFCHETVRQNEAAPGGIGAPHKQELTRCVNERLTPCLKPGGCALALLRRRASGASGAAPHGARAPGTSAPAHRDRAARGGAGRAPECRATAAPALGIRVSPSPVLSARRTAAPVPWGHLSTRRRLLPRLAPLSDQSNEGLR